MSIPGVKMICPNCRSRGQIQCKQELTEFHEIAHAHDGCLHMELGPREETTEGEVRYFCTVCSYSFTQYIHPKTSTVVLQVQVSITHCGVEDFEGKLRTLMDSLPSTQVDVQSVEHPED